MHVVCPVCLLARCEDLSNPLYCCPDRACCSTNQPYTLFLRPVKQAGITLETDKYINSKRSIVLKTIYNKAATTAAVEYKSTAYELALKK